MRTNTGETMAHKLTPTFDKFKAAARHAFTRAVRNNDKQYFVVVECIAELDSEEGVNSADTDTMESIQTLVEVATQQIEKKYPNLGCPGCDDEKVILVKLHEIADWEKEITGKEFEVECPECVGSVRWSSLAKDKTEAGKQILNHLNKVHPDL